ncbi:unnamed protein product, partial [Laminaria digitata]
GTWSVALQEALGLGPSHVTMPAVPSAFCYQLAMECCVDGGCHDEALALLSEMEGRGLSPNEAGLRALIRGFAAEGVGDGGGGGGGGGGEAGRRRWRGVENALGVFEELAEKFNPPSRASFESAIDACVSHPDGLQHAGELISRMKAVGHDLAADHYNVLIRGFGDARNLGAALNVFQEMREGAAVGGPGGGPRSRTLGWEVDEDMFAALLGACTRSGEAENVSEAIGFLRMNGVNPPREILSYLQNDEIESELYDTIFGEKDRKAGKGKERSRGRKYGTHALAAHFVGTETLAPEGGDEGTDAPGGKSRVGGGNSRGGGKGGKGDRTKQSGSSGKEKTFVEVVRDSLSRLEKKRIRTEKAEKEGGAAPALPHPVGWVGTFTEVFTHAERKEEALKRKAGEARSRERRAKRQEDERLAAGIDKAPGAAVDSVPKSIDKVKGGIPGTAPGGGGDGSGSGSGGGRESGRRTGGVSTHRRRGGGGSGGRGGGDEARLVARPARPLLVKVGGGGGGGQGSMTEEPSPVLDALVAGLRRKGSNSKWRGRRGSGMSSVPSAPLSRRKEGGG